MKTLIGVVRFIAIDKNIVWATQCIYCITIIGISIKIPIYLITIDLDRVLVGRKRIVHQDGCWTRICVYPILIIPEHCVRNRWVRTLAINTVCGVFYDTTVQDRARIIAIIIEPDTCPGWRCIKGCKGDALGLNRTPIISIGTIPNPQSGIFSKLNGNTLCNLQDGQLAAVILPLDPNFRVQIVGCTI